MNTNIVNIKGDSYDVTLCIKQHLSNIFEDQFMKKLTNTEILLKKVLLIKKACILLSLQLTMIACFG